MHNCGHRGGRDKVESQHGSLGLMPSSLLAKRRAAHFPKGPSQFLGDSSLWLIAGSVKEIDTEHLNDAQGSFHDRPCTLDVAQAVFEHRAQEKRLQSKDDILR